jgi:hypothetical protein
MEEEFEDTKVVIRIRISKGDVNDLLKMYPPKTYATTTFGRLHLLHVYSTFCLWFRARKNKLIHDLKTIHL